MLIQVMHCVEMQVNVGSGKWSNFCSSTDEHWHYAKQLS